MELIVQMEHILMIQHLGVNLAHLAVLYVIIKQSVLNVLQYISSMNFNV